MSTRYEDQTKRYPKSPNLVTNLNGHPVNCLSIASDFGAVLAADGGQQPDAAVRGGEPAAGGDDRDGAHLHAADRGQPGPAPLGLRLPPRRQQLQPGDAGRGPGT